MEFGRVLAARANKLMFRMAKSGMRREALYDRLYSLPWGETTTNNYGYAPASGNEPERFQLQLYSELLSQLRLSLDVNCVTEILEISCGRGGGLNHLAQRLPCHTQMTGLDSSAHAIGFCKEHYAAQPRMSFVCGHALHLPFDNASFDLVVSVEASHAYRADAAFLREVRRVLRPRGRFLFADYRTRSKVPMLEHLASAAGLAGELRDITANVVSACELDAERRRRIIRAGLPWYSHLLLARSLEGYSAVPGTINFERFRSGDRMYFLSCMKPQ
jgi:SAM-dependent methyltransferase